MKKLAYIILVIAILVVISHFVKQGNVTQTAAETTAAAVTAETPATIDTTAVPAEDNDVVDVQENIEDIIIEDEVPEDDGAVDVEETNPEETIDEEETIVKE